MNIDYRKVFLALVAAIIISIPTAAAFQNRNQLIDTERQNNSRLELDIQKKDSEIEKIKIQTEEQQKKDAAEKEKLKRENEQLQKDLQAKRERQAEEARLAAAQASKPAAVSVPRTARLAGGSCESYRSAVAQYDWDVNTMMRIMNAESGCNPVNHNHADNHRSCLGSYGLFQIGCVHGYSVAYLESASNNIAAAYKIYKSQGYTAWTTY